MTPTTGIVLRPQSPPEEMRGIVAAASDAGIAELWVWEDCFLQAGVTTAAAALAWSEKMRVGIGLLPVPLRNPALLAMELATLSRTWPGRLSVALGHGVQEWMAQVGAAVDSPMTLLRETAVAVRDLLSGATVSDDGRYVHLESVTLQWPPPVPPGLLLGGRGPRTVRLAGELADGVLLDAVFDAEGVRRARTQVDEGHARSGRPGRAVVAVYTELDPTPAPGSLAAEVEERVQGLAQAGADTVIVQSTAEQPDPRPLIEALAAMR